MKKILLLIFISSSLFSFSQKREYKLNDVYSYFDNELKAKQKLLSKLEENQHNAQLKLSKLGVKNIDTTRLVLQDSHPYRPTQLSYQREYLVLKARTDSLKTKSISKAEKYKSKIDELENKKESLERIEKQISEKQKQIEGLQSKYINQIKVLSNSDSYKKAEKLIYYWKQSDKGWKNLSGFSNLKGKMLLTWVSNDNGFSSYFQSVMKNVSALNGLMLDAEALEKKGFQTKRAVNELIGKNTGQTFNSPSSDPRIVQGLNTIDSLKAHWSSLESFGWKPHFNPNPYRGLPFKQRLKVQFNSQPAAPIKGRNGSMAMGVQCQFLWTKRLMPSLGLAYGLEIGGKNNFYLKDNGIVGRLAMSVKGTKILSLTCSAEYKFNHYYMNSVRYFTKDISDNTFCFYSGLTINTGALANRQGNVFIGYDINSIGKSHVVSPLIFRFSF
jgi:hypothetical protein